MRSVKASTSGSFLPSLKMSVSAEHSICATSRSTTMRPSPRLSAVPTTSYPIPLRGDQGVQGGTKRAAQHGRSASGESWNDRRAAHYDLHPDGLRVAFAQSPDTGGEKREKIVFVLNFLDEIRRRAASEMTVATGMRLTPCEIVALNGAGGA